MTTRGGDDINIVPGNSRDYFQDHEDCNDGTGDHDDDPIDDSTDRTTTRDAGAGTGTTGGGPTNFNLRVEQNKSPEFFSAKSKDTISAADFIRQLEDLARTNLWSDAQIYHHFATSPTPWGIRPGSGYHQ